MRREGGATQLLVLHVYWTVKNIKVDKIMKRPAQVPRVDMHTFPSAYTLGLARHCVRFVKVRGVITIFFHYNYSNCRTDYKL